MAPLKSAIRSHGDFAPGGSLPCLKGHGPIEALVNARVVSTLTMLPCLKGHGPIEAFNIPSVLADRLELPCLKGHGPIEALSGGCLP